MVDDVVLAPEPTTLPAVGEGEITALVTRGLGRITGGDRSSRSPACTSVARCGAGLDNIDTATAQEGGVTVVSTPASPTGAVAEHALMLALCLARQTVRLARTATSQGDWAIRDGFLFASFEVGVPGSSDSATIGSQVAELSAAVGMDVVGWTRHHRTDTSVVSGRPRRACTRRAMRIHLSVALAPETTGLIDTAALNKVRPGLRCWSTRHVAPLVDLAAIADTLDRGPARRYQTDVWDPEPPAGGNGAAHPSRVLA